MKRVLFTVLAVGVLASQASAAMYVLDPSVAHQFTQINAPTASNKLQLGIDWPGTASGTAFLTNGDFAPPADVYGVTMQLNVGFVGYLGGGQVITIGASPTLAGFDSFGASIANDDDDPWTVQLYAIDGGGTHTSGWIALGSNSQTFLTVPSVDFSTLSGLGFEVKGERFPADNFNVSVVPVPAALILGLLGMGAAGLKLRRFA